MVEKILIWKTCELDMLREQKNVGNFYGGKCKEFGLEFQNIFE